VVRVMIDVIFMRMKWRIIILVMTLIDVLDVVIVQQYVQHKQLQ
jgi:hypothetical protein